LDYARFEDIMLFMNEYIEEERVVYILLKGGSTDVSFIGPYLKNVIFIDIGVVKDYTVKVGNNSYQVYGLPILLSSTKEYNK